MADVFNQLFVLLQIWIVPEVVLVRARAIQSFGSLVQSFPVGVLFVSVRVTSWIVCYAREIERSTKSHELTRTTIPDFVQNLPNEKSINTLSAKNEDKSLFSALQSRL